MAVSMHVLGYQMLCILLIILTILPSYINAQSLQLSINAPSTAQAWTSDTPTCDGLKASATYVSSCRVAYTYSYMVTNPSTTALNNIQLTVQGAQSVNKFNTYIQGADTFKSVNGNDAATVTLNTLDAQQSKTVTVTGLWGYATSGVGGFNVTTSKQISIQYVSSDPQLPTTPSATQAVTVQPGVVDNCCGTQYVSQGSGLLFEQSRSCMAGIWYQYGDQRCEKDVPPFTYNVYYSTTGLGTASAKIVLNSSATTVPLAFNPQYTINNATYNLTNLFTYSSSNTSTATWQVGESYTIAFPNGTFSDSICSAIAAGAVSGNLTWDYVSSSGRVITQHVDDRHGFLAGCCNNAITDLHAGDAAYYYYNEDYVTTQQYNNYQCRVQPTTAPISKVQSSPASRMQMSATIGVVIVSLLMTLFM